MAEGANFSKTIGVVADLTLKNESDHTCKKCSVFGLSDLEYEAITKFYKVTPTFYNEDQTDRHLVHCNPWTLMRILGENFGYSLTVTPLFGRIPAPSGERKTCVWTLVSSSK